LLIAPECCGRNVGKLKAITHDDLVILRDAAAKFEDIAELVGQFYEFDVPRKVDTAL